MDLTNKIDGLKVEIKDKVELDTTLVNKVKDLEVAEDNTHPCLRPPIEDYITLDHFDISFEKGLDMEGQLVYMTCDGISKPPYNIRKEKYSAKKVFMYCGLYKDFVYFGKPTRKTNWATDADIIWFINKFNESRQEWMDVAEYALDDETPKLVTRYYAPRITKIEFPGFDKSLKGVKKYFIAEVHFNSLEQSSEGFSEPTTVKE